MTAFDDAFYILKNEYSFDLTHDSLLLKGKFEEANQLRGMRQFVLENENSADPAMRQAAEDMYQKLTQIMSAQSGTAPMQQPQGPVGEGANLNQMNAPPPQHPMMKAWTNLKKNVISQQDGQQYSMPPAIASMAQRPQVPETAPTGFLGGQRPTGDMTTGGPQTMNVQENQANMGTAFEQQGHIPGMAQVTRAPHPSPFGNREGGVNTGKSVNPQDYEKMTEYNRQNPSFSGANFEEGNTNHMGRPEVNNFESNSETLMDMGHRDQRGFETTAQVPGGTYGDQFAPSRQF